MVDWHAKALQSRLSVVNMNVSFLVLGLYGWEYLQTLDVEYAVLRGRLSFRWPLIPYLVGRLCLFIFLILLSAVRATPPPSALNCLPGALATAIIGNISLACSSTNLMIRTWMIWKDSRLVHTLLLIFALGHCIVLALDVANLQPTPSGERCTIYITHPSTNAAVFVYSLCYDFLILVLSIAGLSTQRSKSSLGKRLRAQGLVYFVIAVVTYITPTVFSILGVMPMVSITGISAITASMIASYRAVRSLLGLRTPSGQTTEESGESELALTSQIPVHTATPASAVVG